MVENSYIVQLQDDIQLSSEEEIKASIREYITFEYQYIFKGFAVKGIPTDEMIQVLDNDLVMSVSPVRHWCWIFRRGIPCSA